MTVALSTQSTEAQSLYIIWIHKSTVVFTSLIHCWWAFHKVKNPFRVDKSNKWRGESCLSILLFYCAADSDTWQNKLINQPQLLTSAEQTEIEGRLWWWLYLKTDNDWINLRNLTSPNNRLEKGGGFLVFTWCKNLHDAAMKLSEQSRVLLSCIVRYLTTCTQKQSWRRLISI